MPGQVHSGCRQGRPEGLEMVLPVVERSRPIRPDLFRHLRQLVHVDLAAGLSYLHINESFLIFRPAVIEKLINYFQTFLEVLVDRVFVLAP